MSEENVDARPLTSVELLDAAVWREIDSDEAPAGGGLSGGTIAPGWTVAHGALRRPRNGCCDCVVQGKGLYRTPGGSPNDERRDRMEKITRCYRCALVPRAKAGDRGVEQTL